MKNLTNIPKAFIAFLVISLLFWLLTKLSKEYTTIVNFPITYTDLPQDKILQKNPIKAIDLLLKGSGFKLFVANFKDKEISISTKNISKKENGNYSLLLNNQRPEIQKQLPSGLQLEQIVNEIIHLKLGRLSIKKVPIISNFFIKYQLGYELSEKIILEPDSITLAGPLTQIDIIKGISLERINLEDVSNDIKREVNILNINQLKEKGIKLSHNKVKAFAKVDKFTEGVFEIPFTLKNVPSETEISTFPKTVKVIYKIGLKDFNKVSENSFLIVCDYQKSIANNVTYLIPEIVNQPNLIKSVKVFPKKIEYLIHK